MNGLDQSLESVSFGSFWGCHFLLMKFISTLWRCSRAPWRHRKRRKGWFIERFERFRKGLDFFGPIDYQRVPRDHIGIVFGLMWNFAFITWVPFNAVKFVITLLKVTGWKFVKKQKCRHVSHFGLVKRAVKQQSFVLEAIGKSRSAALVMLWYCFCCSGTTPVPLRCCSGAVWCFSVLSIRNSNFMTAVKFVTYVNLCSMRATSETL